MNITTTKETLLTALTLAERLVGKKESLPVLSCVVFDVTDTCVLRATNLEAGIEITIQADIKEKGTCAIPAHILSQTIRTLSGDKIVLRLDGDNVGIESKGSTSLLKAISAEEFPQLTNTGGDTFTLPRALLLKGLQSVIYAASTSMIRPELGSVLLRLKDETLTCVATDSFRLAEKKITGVGGEERELLLPLKHAQELMHTLEHVTSETIILAVHESQLTAHMGGVTFLSRVIDATFPNYTEVIPKEFSTEVTVLKSDIVDVMRKARIFAGTDQHFGIHVYPQKKICSVTAQSPQVGEMSDSLDGALSGSDIDINFHIGYFVDCLSHIPSDSVVLGFAGAGRPLVIRGVSDASFTYLAMPLNR